MLCDLEIFSGKVYHPEPPHAQSLFLFPIVFGINLIQFFDGKNKIGLGKIWSFVLGFRSLVARLVPFERGGRKPEALNIFGNGKCELIANFSATWPLREGRDGKCEGGNEKCAFLARKSVSSSPIVRIFGKGKCKFIANFSATMVTSLPSLSLSLSLSLSVCISLSHQKYLTHNIGSASALPIIGVKRILILCESNNSLPAQRIVEYSRIMRAWINHNNYQAFAHQSRKEKYV